MDRSLTDRPLYVVAAWGVLGFSAILVNAIWSLTPLALQPITAGSMALYHWALYVVWVGFMAYSEGYKGFQRHMSPRVAARAMYAATHPRPALVLLAPLFCMGLFHATRKRLIVSWSILIGVIVLIVLVRYLEQPWRGIVDGGVVVGLSWGLVATLWFFVQSLLGRALPTPPDVPTGETAS